MVSSPSTVKTGTFDFGSLLSSAINFGSSALNDYTNYRMNENTNAANAQMVSDTNAANESIAQNTNAMNAAINEQNIALTREQNAINREREDNAVRRRVNDLIGAGLSKTLAAGSPASANAMQAPQATQGMVTGHAMQAARYNAYRSDNLAASGRLITEQMLANKELNVKSRALDIEEQELSELYRHNKAVEAETNRSNVARETETYRSNVAGEKEAARGHDIDERYLGQQDKWKRWELAQNSKFHDDAVRLDEARIAIERLNSWSQRNLNAVHELWYQCDMDLAKHADDREAAKLTADLAESTARISQYYENVKLSEKQRQVLSSQIPYYAALTAEAYARKHNLNADTKNTLTDYLIKCWNMSIAQKEKTTYGGSVPSQTELAELKKNRIASYVTKGVSTGLSVGAGIFLGSGGGKFINKLLGMDSHEPMGFIK